MKRLLLLMPSNSYRAGAFLAAAGRLDAEIVIGTDRSQASAEFASGRVARFDFRDLDSGVGEILAFARGSPPDAIVAAEEEAVLLAAHAARALGLEHNSPEAVAAARDKYLMRTKLAAAAVPTPGFRLLSIDDDPAAAAEAVEYPCVLKPVRLAASRGVIRADDSAAFAAAFARITKILDDCAREGVSAGRQLLVEDYLPGPEVALEGLLESGRLRTLALFDKPDPMDGPYFEETIYVTPSRLARAVQERIADMAERAAAALGLAHGPVHAELRITEAGIRVIEIAARSIGGQCGRTLRFGAGLGLEELILRHALGLPIASRTREPAASGVMMIPIPAAGVLRAVHGLATARGVAGIDAVNITIPIGQPLTPLPEGHEYLGFIFARARAPDEVEAALRAAHTRLAFVIEPGAA